MTDGEKDDVSAVCQAIWLVESHPLRSLSIALADLIRQRGFGRVQAAWKWGRDHGYFVVHDDYVELTKPGHEFRNFILF